MPLETPALRPLPLDPGKLDAGSPGELIVDLRRAHAASAHRLAAGFWEGAPVSDLVRARAWAVDHLLARLWRDVVGEDNGIALLAVGGYGRGELHPHSDVDVLVLLETAPSGAQARSLERLVAASWDIGLDLGHSVRTLDECVGAAEADVTVLTNLMEARCLQGDESLAGRLAQRIGPERMWSAPAFFQAKWAEQAERHARFHDTAYNLEPNLKEGPGGLRDIQTIAWVARRHLGSTSLHDLVSAGFLDETEFAELLQGREYLWGVRYALHLVTGRGEERLLFDHQRELAQRLGFRDEHGQNLAVEQFMRRYYRTVMKLEVLNDLLLRHYQSTLADIGSGSRAVALNERFNARGDALEAADPNVFGRDPVAILEAFLLIARHERLSAISAATLRLIHAYRDRVAGLDADSRARDTFLSLLRESTGVYRGLQLMNRYGVLGRYLPAFGRIVGHMQYDLFHVYTVDQHTLFVVRNLREMAAGRAPERFPQAGEVFNRIEKPELLYLAGLFHDIAKGRGGDHSELGAEEARRFCEHHGLPRADGNLVAWLVRHHLLMSATAQRKDIQDPAVINEFARAVGDRRHLDHLYLLTMADIAATDPKLWNSWKDHLLAELYTAARYALRRGLENPIDRNEWIRQTREEARTALLESGIEGTCVEAIWAVLPEDYFHRLSADQVAWQTRTLLEAGAHEPPLVKARRTARGDSTEVLVYTPDVERLFATIAATLDGLGLNVVEARIFTTSDGYALDSFRVLNRQGRPLEHDESTEACEALARRLARVPLTLPRVSRAVPRRLRHFAAPTRVIFDPEPDSGRTQLSVVATDRPGLLSDLGRAFAAYNIRVHGARIATFGARVEDFFSITDLGGLPLEGEDQTRRLKAEILKRLDDRSEQEWRTS